MLLVIFFGSDAFFEQLRCAAGWNTFQNKKIHQQHTQPQLVYSTLGGRKCGCTPRTQPISRFAVVTVRKSCIHVLSVYIRARSILLLASLSLLTLEGFVNAEAALDGDLNSARTELRAEPYNF